MSVWSTVTFEVWAVIVFLGFLSIALAFLARSAEKDVVRLEETVKRLLDEKEAVRARLGQPIPQNELDIGTRYQLVPQGERPEFTWVRDLITGATLLVLGKVELGSGPATEFVIHKNSAGDRIPFTRHYPSAT